MKPMKSQTIANSHKKKLINGAKIIFFASMVLQVLCLYGIFTDYDHVDAYCIAFVFVSITAAFGLIMHDEHKKNL